MHISSDKLLQMNGKSSTFTIKLHLLHEQIVWVPSDPRDDQVDPNWSFVRLMKSSTTGLSLSHLFASYMTDLTAGWFPNAIVIDYKIIVLLIYLVVSSPFVWKLFSYKWNKSFSRELKNEM